MDGLVKDCCNSKLPVTTADSCTVLYDRHRTVPANEPDIILRANNERWCKLIEVSVPAKKTPDRQRRGQKDETQKFKRKNSQNL